LRLFYPSKAFKTMNFCFKWFWNGLRKGVNLQTLTRRSEYLGNHG